MFLKPRIEEAQRGEVIGKSVERILKSSARIQALSMLPYELTPAAEADLREIARYTLRQWGVRQQQQYARLLAGCFLGIAEGSVRARNFSERYPQVQVTRCEHHYVFFLHPRKKPGIIAVLHERMEMLTRIGSVYP